MKIIHWTIIFVLIVVPFSLVCRNIINTRFIALKEEVRINNAIDTATYDAVDLLIEIAEVNNGKRIDLNPTLCMETINQFFNTMTVNYNMPYNEESKQYLQDYIPAIIIVGYDGFYIYSAEETENGVEHILKPKIPYSYEDSNGNIINFTLDNQITIFMPQLGKTYSGELHDKDTYDDEYNQFKGISLENLPYVTNNLSLIFDRIAKEKSSIVFENFLVEGTPSQDYEYDENGVLINNAGAFHQKRREVITNLIVAALEEEVMQHNSYAQLLGVNYNFTIPDISKEEWINAIDDISVLSFIQGIPLGTDQYYNNYALGGSRITRGTYIYGGIDGRYHKESCPLIRTDGELDYSKIQNIYFNKEAAALDGCYWCTECQP